MEKDLLEIINHYGVNNQLRKFNEECYELIEAIITHELKKSVEYEIPLTEIVGTREHLIEELGDNFVMLKQFQAYYGITDEEINDVMLYKIDRQKKRMEDEK